jgi:hypothetical protein
LASSSISVRGLGFEDFTFFLGFSTGCSASSSLDSTVCFILLRFFYHQTKKSNQIKPKLINSRTTTQILPRCQASPNYQHSSFLSAAPRPLPRYPYSRFLRTVSVKNR